MKSLAAQAGLARKGELIFLRTNPKLVSASQLAGDCNVKSGSNFIEQGCFVVDSGGRERIYLRQMPSDLQAVEIVTAGHEMLHAAYASLNQSTQKNVDQEVASEYKTLNNKALQARMADYSKTEPGAQDNELHSILGTEFSSLPAALENYYSQYFTNRSLVVGAHNQINQKFAGLKAQLDQQQASVKADEATANALYNQSASAAAAGDARGDSYYYQRYGQEVNLVNQLIGQYNQTTDQYNALAAEYNGKPASSLPSLQS